MNHYVQNNFNQSAIAQENKGKKAMVIVTAVLTVLMFAAFKHAIGG